MDRVCKAAIIAVAVLMLPVVASHAQPQQPAACVPVVAPVCALKDGTKRSYWNECQARLDGAYVLRTGECRIPRSPG